MNVCRQKTEPHLATQVFVRTIFYFDLLFVKKIKNSALIPNSIG